MDKNDAIVGHIGVKPFKESRNEGLILPIEANPESGRSLTLLQLKKCLKYAGIKPTGNYLYRLRKTQREADRGRCRNAGFFDTHANKENMSIYTFIHPILKRT